MKEKVLKTFSDLGFELEELEEFGYSFDYEGTHYFYIPNDENEEFLDISIPGVYDMEESNNQFFYELMDNINSSIMYVKAYNFSKSIWLFYERELFGEEDLSEIISNMILHLERAKLFVYSCIEKEEENDNKPEITTKENSTETEE